MTSKVVTQMDRIPVSSKKSTIGACPQLYFFLVIG